MCALLALTVMAFASAAHGSAVEDLVNTAVLAIQNRQQHQVFPGLLSADFEGYVGGWGPTTCTTYNRKTFTTHVDGWQSTWATNFTLFNVRSKFVTEANNGVPATMAIELQIAYLAQPQFGGPAVNAYNVVQFWEINAAGTQITRFLELSALVTAPNSTAMLQSTSDLLTALNTKNTQQLGGVYTPDASVAMMGRKQFSYFNQSAWVAFNAQSFAARQNELAFFSQQQFAVCSNFVFFLWTSIQMFNPAVAAQNVATALLGYSKLNADGKIQKQVIWTKDGIASNTQP